MICLMTKTAEEVLEMFDDGGFVICFMFTKNVNATENI